MFLLLYVDDTLIASNSPSATAKVKNILRYIVKDHGMISQFLSIHILQQATPQQKFFLSQARYIETMLYKFDYQNCNAASTPAIDGTDKNSADKLPYVD